MSLINSSERNEIVTSYLITEITERSDGNDVNLNHTLGKEKFEEGCNNLKLEDGVLIKEEIKEFIDEKYDQKYDNNSLNWDRTNISKDFTTEEIVKDQGKGVHSMSCGTLKVKSCKKEEYMINYSNLEEVSVGVKEEIEFEECNPFIQSSVFVPPNSGSLLETERGDFPEYTVDHLVPSQESSTEKFSCSDCNMHFKLKCDLKYHIVNEHNKQLNCYCIICEESFNLRRDLNRHNKLCHEVGLKEKRKEYSCSECLEAFSSPREMKIHTKTSHQFDTLGCCYCSKVFYKKSALKSHYKISHIGSFKYDYICEICGKVFNFPSNLARHAKIHSGHKPHTCETCGKEFSRLDHLQLHKKMKIHEVRENEQNREIVADKSSDVEKFICEICGFGFRVKQRLRDHLKLHSEERPHVCTVCDRAFKQIYNLKQHMLSHDGPRNFLCDICSKGFRRKAFLKQHMLVHTKEKKYTCEICGKKYYKSCHVTAHKKAAHTNLIQQINKSVPKKDQLVTGEIAGTCDTCNKVYYKKSALIQHVLTHLK